MATEPSEHGRVVTRAVGTGGALLARVQSRVQELREIHHAGVLVPERVGVADGDTVVVTSPWIDGVDLAELERRRTPLTAGECVWLGTRIAAALEALHAQGIAHGDVAPSNVLLADGQVVLVDTVGGCLDDEHGTMGFRAPERRDGATLAGDVYSLGALLRWCVTDAERVPIEAWTAPLVVRDPQSRPPVQVAARALASCAPASPVDVPARTEVVSAVRARAAERTERIAEGRAFRARRVVWRAASGLAVAAAAVLAVVAVPRVVDAATATPPAAVASPTPWTSASTAHAGSSVESPDDAGATPPAAPTPEVEEARTPAQDAAARLTRQRIEALSAGDGEALLETTGAGPLADDAGDLARDLDTGRVRYEDLAVEVREVRVEKETADSATAVVRYDISEHRIVGPEGSTQVQAFSQAVVLDLRWDGRWHVERARPRT